MVLARFAVLAVAAAVALTATGVRIGNHAAYVRVVVDFNGKVPANQVEFVKLSSRVATLQLNHSGVKTETMGASGEGVQVALQPGTQALHIAASFAPRRFKYVSYAVVTGSRLAIDLWKSAPPPGGGAFGYGDCLRISSSHVNKGSVSVSGTESGVFEHMFQVVVRGANGRVLGKRAVADSGSWNTTVHYTAAHRQAGTLEAVSFSPKDGSLECLYEKRVTLPAS